MMAFKMVLFTVEAGNESAALEHEFIHQQNAKLIQWAVRYLIVFERIAGDWNIDCQPDKYAVYQSMD
jgi:hypothetical protein